MLILNVEDYEAARYVKTRLLRNAGFFVEEASTGAAALEKLERLRPSLVLLDVRLPDIDGLEICRRIRANPVLQTMFVVQTSAAFISNDDVALGYASGADQYLPAPFEPRDLIKIIRSFVH